MSVADDVQPVDLLLQSPLTADFEVLLEPITKISAFMTQFPHGSPPSTSFNKVIPLDLRQTPSELHGLPMQRYVYVTTCTERPPISLVHRLHLLISGAEELYQAHEAAVQGLAAAGDDEGGGSTALDDLEKAEMSALLRLCDMLTACTSGSAGFVMTKMYGDALEDLAVTVRSVNVIRWTHWCDDNRRDSCFDCL